MPSRPMPYSPDTSPTLQSGSGGYSDPYGGATGTGYDERKSTQYFICDLHPPPTLHLTFIRILLLWYLRFSVLFFL